MRIGIVTQPLVSNYGGILQNYALQTVLKRMGHEAWTMDYYKYGWFDWANSYWRVMAHKLLGHKVHFPVTPSEWKCQEAPLRRFVFNHIQLTQPRTKHFEEQTVKNYHFDTLLVGSDQVWRPQYNYDVADCFLKFAKDLSVKRVAYGASFGTDNWEFTDKQTVECVPLIRHFDAVSVRESSGVDLCRKHLGVEAEHVLDPTLLLHAVDFMELCKDIPQREPFVFAYILDGNEEKKQMIKDFAARKGLQYFIKSANAAVSMEDTVELWLSYFRDAAYIITDSFHGVAFSINFNKEFYAFANAQRGNSRFSSLLGLLGLEYRIVKDNLLKNASPIVWEDVNKKREQTLEHSLNWLKKALRK